MPDAVLNRAVEIVVEGNARFLRGAKKREADRERVYGMETPSGPP